MGSAVIFKTSDDVVPRAPNASSVGANSVNLPAPFRVSIRPARVTRAASVVWLEELTTTSTMVSASAVTEPARASSTAQSRPRESMLMVTARDVLGMCIGKLILRAHDTRGKGGSQLPHIKAKIIRSVRAEADT